MGEVRCGVDLSGALLDAARAGGARSLFVVGTGKNVGKTVAVSALSRRAHASGSVVGITSLGRDGEAVDASDGAPKPRLTLCAGTIVATARNLLPRHPASEVLDLSPLHTAAGRLAFARVRAQSQYEIAGPSTASGIRAVVERLFEFGAQQVICDGAIDRLAALAGGDDATIVATGAAAAASVEEAVENVRDLVARLRLARYDPSQPHRRIDGALTPTLAARLIAEGERRVVVVRDPTQVALPGKSFSGVVKRLVLRCERPLRVVAVTVASIAGERYFEPRSLLREVARATSLPAFDLYAGAMAS